MGSIVAISVTGGMLLLGSNATWAWQQLPRGGFFGVILIAQQMNEEQCEFEPSQSMTPLKCNDRLKPHETLL